MFSFLKRFLPSKSRTPTDYARVGRDTSTNRSGELGRLQYPCYTVVPAAGAKTGDIEQGDILRGFRVHTLPASAQSPEWDGKGATAVPATVIVMTQSCDIAEEKVDNIVLCPVFTKAAALEYDPGLKKKWNDILAKKMHRFHPLLPCDIPGHEFDESVVDFGLIFSVPADHVVLVAQRGDRVTVCSPYREELSNRFAQSFARVALPD